MSYDAIQWIQAESLFIDWEVPYELVPDLSLDSVKVEDYSQVREESTAPRPRWSSATP